MKKISILYIVVILCVACSKNKSQNVEANSGMEHSLNNKPCIDEENICIRYHEPEPEEKHTLHSDSKHIYNESEVDVSPSFPNGVNAEMAFVNKNKKAPLMEGFHKAIAVEIIVEKDGSISSAKVVKSIDKVHDEDALAIIKKMPLWQPAMIGNTKVRCKSIVPIPYRK